MNLFSEKIRLENPAVEFHEDDIVILRNPINDGGFVAFSSVTKIINSNAVIPICVGTTNILKLRTVKESAEEALSEMWHDVTVCVIGLNVESKVKEQPIGEEVLEGAKNRCDQAHFIAHDIGIRKGLLIGIEGGFIDTGEGDKVIVTKIMIHDKDSFYQDNAECSRMPISELAFSYLGNGNDINELIGKNLQEIDYNKKLGITGFLSHGQYDRKTADKIGLKRLIKKYLCHINGIEYQEEEVEGNFEELFDPERARVLDTWIETEIKERKGSYIYQDILSWEETFMGMAILVSMRSKDPSTKVGAVIVGKDNRVLSVGYNGTPNGVPDEVFNWGNEGATLDTKYPYVIHAEPNAILNFKGLGSDLEGSTIYVTLFPCGECAKLLVQKGIKRVIYHCDKYAKTDLVIAAKRLFDMTGVEYIDYHTLIGSKKDSIKQKYGPNSLPDQIILRLSKENNAEVEK